jgi:hypothetical protein
VFPRRICQTSGYLWKASFVAWLIRFFGVNESNRLIALISRLETFPAYVLLRTLNDVVEARARD